MKNILSIIHKPKHVTAISVSIALVIAIIGLMFINKAPAYKFVKAEPGTIENIWSLSLSTNGSGQNLTMSFLASGRVTNVSVKAGDSVKGGQILATLDPENTLGALTQARAAYEAATANYNKLVNGATSADVAVSSSSLNSAKTALDHTEVVLLQAINNSLVSGTNAMSNTNNFFSNPYSQIPTLLTNGFVFSNPNLQNKIQIERAPLNDMINSWNTELNGINTSSDLDTIAAHSENNLQSIGSYLDDLNSLYSKNATANSGFESMLATDQNIIISARASITGQIATLTSAAQAVSSAEANLTQSQANLTLKTTSARPEDIAAAKAQVSNASGAVQIAQAAYNNRIITAPGDGMVTAVYITVGQTAAPGTPAIDLSGKTASKNVLIMVPNNSIIDREGNYFVLVKTPGGTVEKSVMIGSHDSTNTEIISGLSDGDEVAIH